MIGTSGTAVQSPERPSETRELQWLWVEQYGPAIAAQLEPNGRYALMRIGAAEFAFSDFGEYLRALGGAWAAGLDPQPLPTVPGTGLTRVAPHLRGVDTISDGFGVRAAGP